ncbi:MAG: murein hydrolase activator EnvC family protein, partial [Aquificaceae bacterium]
MTKGILLLGISLSFAFAVECKNYTIKEGDTLQKIAKSEGVDIQSLKSANKNLDEKRLRIGQTICIPVKAQAKKTETAKTSQTQRREVAYDFYTIKRGGRLEDVSKATGVPLRDLERLNPELKDKWLQAGTKVKIPKQEQARAERAAISRREERSILEERERREPISLPPTFSIQPPVEGKISKVQKGIEIHTNCSATVRAVDSGRVIYSGGDLQAYGNMVIIEHDRFISLYAYNESNLVKRGDRVSKGQIIARVGKKNNSDECVLRFEIRSKEGVPLDPTEYMK